MYLSRKSPKVQLVIVLLAQKYVLPFTRDALMTMNVRFRRDVLWKCDLQGAIRNKCLTTSNKKLLGTSALLVVTSATLPGARSY